MLHLGLYLKHRKNKILAVGLSGLATVLLCLCFFLDMSALDWMFDFTTLWNYLLYFIAYLIILICNIRNDNAAYRGITLFVFFMAFDQIWSGLMMGGTAFALFSGADPVSLTLVIIYLLSVIVGGVLGFILYAKIFKYMINPLADYRPVRKYGIIYSSSLFFILALLIGTEMYVNPLASALDIAVIFLLPISELIMSVAIVFTLERLYRK